MSWQLLTAIGVITFSISVLLRRILLYRDKSDPIAYVIVFQSLVGLVTGVYAFIHGFQMPDLSEHWFAILLTIFLFAAANVASARQLHYL